MSATREERAEPDPEKIRAYGRGEIRASELTDQELEMATDGLDALDFDFS